SSAGLPLQFSILKSFKFTKKFQGNYHKPSQEVKRSFAGHPSGRISLSIILDDNRQNSPRPDNPFLSCPYSLLPERYPLLSRPLILDRGECLL
ncbi:MAG TPA: hypothetical protein PKG72_07245, partial [Smithellaceae bacterium]|nr:hypothetical protein [Smithellaceae bacterium]